jgi:hypothetical protein
VNEGPIIIFPGDYETQDAATARLKDKVIDPAGVVGNQDRRAIAG